jgi:hypothetical protein
MATSCLTLGDDSVHDCYDASSLKSS